MTTRKCPAQMCDPVLSARPQRQQEQPSHQEQRLPVFRPSQSSPPSRGAGAAHEFPGDLHRMIAAEEIRDSVRDELLVDKEATIMEMRETMGILEKKIRKLEQLVKIKDAKIQTLSSKLRAAGVE